MCPSGMSLFLWPKVAVGDMVGKKGTRTAGHGAHIEWFQEVVILRKTTICNGVS